MKRYLLRFRNSITKSIQKEEKQMEKLKIGIGITGSFCCFDKTIEVLKELKKLNYELIPIISFNVQNITTRFFDKNEFKLVIESICGNEAITSIEGAEPIGPKAMLDAFIILPCTGNTLGKIANGITDTPVTMAFKAHLRNERPIIVCVSTNDGLSTSFNNLAKLYNKKCVFIAPFLQDDSQKKPNSLVVDFDKITKTLELALERKQIQPVICSLIDGIGK